MLRSFLPVMALIATAPAVAQDARPLDGTQWAQLSIHQRVVIRIPRVPQAMEEMAQPAPPPVRWVEKRADRCVAMSSLAGAKLTRPDAIDLLLAGGGRLRAMLGECPALDFYNGFYFRGTADGMVCAKRDAVQMRSGATCPIRSFKRLVPKR